MTTTAAALPQQQLLEIYSRLGREQATAQDKAALASLRSVPNFFCPKGSCFQMQTVDLAPLQDAEELGMSFLYELGSLTKIENLHLLTKIFKCGAMFLCGSRSNPIPISELDLSAFRQLTEVPACFVNYTKILRIDLSGLVAVEHVAGRFLASNPLLESLDCSSLTRVARIDEEFVAHCPALTALTLNLPALRRFGRGFLFAASRLPALDLSSLESLEEIGGNALSGCTALKSIAGLSRLAARAPSLTIRASFCGGDHRTPSQPKAVLTEGEEFLDQLDLAPFLGVPAKQIECEYLALALARLRRRIAIRNVNLVAHKSKSRLAVMLATHWAPLVLVLKFATPKR